MSVVVAGHTRTMVLLHWLPWWEITIITIIPELTLIVSMVMLRNMMTGSLLSSEFHWFLLFCHILTTSPHTGTNKLMTLYTSCVHLFGIHNIYNSTKYFVCSDFVQPIKILLLLNIMLHKKWILENSYFSRLSPRQLESS